MKRMHLKKKKKKNLNIIILIAILIIIVIIYIFKIFNDKAIPHFISYSQIQTKKIVTNVINDTVLNEVAANIELNDLFIITKDDNGDIKSIDFNPVTVNKILVNTSIKVEENIKYLETGDVDKLNLSYSYDYDKLKKGIIYELPSGIIFNNALLINILPKIPVKISLIGNMFCKLNTSVTSYGINNALIKVNLNIEVEVKILLPFISDNTSVSVDVPIIIKIISGEVPSYYFDGYLTSPSITSEVS